MDKFSGILLCTDLDGTLLRNDHTVSAENLEAIEYFKANGGAFTIVTGRVPRSAAQIYEKVKPNVPICCMNGGAIYDHIKGEYVWTRALPTEALTLVEYVGEKLDDVGIQINTFDKIYFTKENSAMENFRKITGMPNLVRRIEDIDEPIAKVVFGYMENEDIERLIELLRAHPLSSKFDFIRSERQLYELLPRGNSKGDVLTRLAEHLGIEMSRTVAVGDYNNDVSMLRAAAVGVAVSNASEEALAAADYVTVSNEEHAIARIISDIEDGRISF